MVVAFCFGENQNTAGHDSWGGEGLLRAFPCEMLEVTEKVGLVGAAAGTEWMRCGHLKKIQPRQISARSLLPVPPVINPVWSHWWGLWASLAPRENPFEKAPLNMNGFLDPFGAIKTYGIDDSVGGIILIPIEDVSCTSFCMVVGAPGARALPTMGDVGWGHTGGQNLARHGKWIFFKFLLSATLLVIC
jgi:hypothetical protein